jgi:hypothetical protein
LPAWLALLVLASLQRATGAVLLWHPLLLPPPHTLRRLLYSLQPLPLLSLAPLPPSLIRPLAAADLSPPSLPIASLIMLSTIDRLDYYAGTHQFWTEYHDGQGSRGYSILSRIASKYSPGACQSGWESMEEGARDVYRAWCVKEGVLCEYDTIKYKIERSDCFDLDDSCVEYFIEQYGDQTLEDSGLINYETSDFVNLDMCYTRDLLRFYSDNENTVLEWFDDWCDAIGASSRLHALEGQTIESPDDLAAALVNMAMTHCARSILSTLQDA